MRQLVAILVPCLVALAAHGKGPEPATWSPAAWADENTVELRTTDPGAEPHWFPVWVVTIDGQLWVRLGSRAAGRFDRNTTKPVVGVRIAGATFERVRGIVDNGKADAVAAAMKDKYWTQGDLFVRYMSHPYTVRLEPEPDDGGQ
jgi:hypothetical protein